MKKIQELQNDIGTFTDVVFKNSTAQSKARHLSEEALEAAAAPDDIMEWADCFILLLDGAHKAGFTVENIYDAAVQKMIINKGRKWGDADEHGISRHIKTGEAA